jgi:acyl-CoA dehydrogenase
VPTSNLIGAPGQAFELLAQAFAIERLWLAIIGYSTADRALTLAREWSGQRETFGRPLSQRQVVRHTLVEMQRQVTVARAFTRSVVVRAAAGENVMLDALLAKKTATDASTYVVDRALQLFGGTGFMTGTEVERHYRDSRILAIGGGAEEVMTDLAATLMGL